MKPRRAQPAITIRSQKAVDRLKLLTRSGRSQVEVIEDALERLPVPADKDDDEAEQFYQKLMGIAQRAAGLPYRWKSMADFDAHEYDENGNLR